MQAQTDNMASNLTKIENFSRNKIKNPSLNLRVKITLEVSLQKIFSRDVQYLNTCQISHRKKVENIWQDCTCENKDDTSVCVLVINLFFWTTLSKLCEEEVSCISYMSFINFTFVLPCIVRDFYLNKQPDALIIRIYSVIKFYVFWGIFCAHHQEISTVHSALVSFMQVSDDRLQAESGWNAVSNVQ